MWKFDLKPDFQDEIVLTFALVEDVSHFCQSSNKWSETGGRVGLQRLFWPRLQPQFQEPGSFIEQARNFRLLWESILLINNKSFKKASLFYKINQYQNGLAFSDLIKIGKTLNLVKTLCILRVEEQHVGDETVAASLQRITPEINFTNIFHKAFMCEDPKSAKKIDGWFYCILGVFGIYMSKSCMWNVGEIDT